MVVRNDIKADLHDQRFLGAGRNREYGDERVCELVLRKKRDVLVGGSDHNEKKLKGMVKENFQWTSVVILKKNLTVIDIRLTVTYLGFLTLT